MATSFGTLGLTKGKFLLVMSLAVTWWFASLFPRYQSALEAQMKVQVGQFKSRLEEARQRLPTIKVDWHTARDEDPRSAYNASKVALLVEPRPLPQLVPQILYMLSVVPPDWRFLFIGSPESIVSAGRAYAIKAQQVIGKLDMMVMPEPWEVNSKEHVFRLLTDIRFYEDFLPDVEWVLKYEVDSILCANSDSSLNDWLHWDWAGAPRMLNDPFSGNGGLSLRRVSTIKRVLKFQSRRNDSQPEDEWFGSRLHVLPGAKIASGTDGALTVEDVYFEKPMGFHVRGGGSQLSDAVWKNHKQREAIFKYCPELSMIMDMKLEVERCEGDDLEGVVHPSKEEEEALKQAAAKAKQEEDARKKIEELTKEHEAKNASSSSAEQTSAKATETDNSNKVTDDGNLR